MYGANYNKMIRLINEKRHFSGRKQLPRAKRHFSGLITSPSGKAPFLGPKSTPEGEAPFRGPETTPDGEINPSRTFRTINCREKPRILFSVIRQSWKHIS
jgi:hypothetical protein